MAVKLPILSVFLLLLFTFQEMMPSEAAMCESRSETFRGLCFRSRNCSTTCQKEGFTFGACKRFKCVCSIDCNTQDPIEGPPSPTIDGPPADYVPLQE